MGAELFVFFGVELEVNVELGNCDVGVVVELVVLVEGVVFVVDVVEVEVGICEDVDVDVDVDVELFEGEENVNFERGALVVDVVVLVDVVELGYCDVGVVVLVKGVEP